jgi:hypothetical protein
VKDLEPVGKAETKKVRGRIAADSPRINLPCDLLGLTSPALPAGGVVTTALLSCARMGLFRLTDIAAIGFVRLWAALNRMIAILDHKFTAEAVLVVSNLCHIELLGTLFVPRQ